MRLAKLFRTNLLAAFFVCLGIAATPAQQTDTSDGAGEATHTLQNEVQEQDQAAATAAQNAQEELERVKQSIAISKERADELRQEISDMKNDRAAQNAELIAAGQRVQLAQIEVDDIEKRLSDLLTKESEIRQRLDGTDSDISALLSALERIGRNPPPALIVNPTDALGAARSASLLGAVVPQLRDRADSITADLNDLVEIKKSVQDQETELKANYKALQEDRLRIATLIEARKRGVDRTSDALEDQQKTASELADKAASLTQLIESLQQKIDTTEAPASTPKSSLPRLSEAEVQAALANTGRTMPAIPFDQARGRLAIPANGVTMLQFGSSDGFGGISEGMSLITSADAQVVAPADGWVLYKGPYLNYGQIVIINPGQGYSILLAGLDSIDVELGQFVLLGEPIGTMGEKTQGRAITTSAGASRPTLYIELRDEDGPIDPTGWWAPQNTETQSG